MLLVSLLSSLISATKQHTRYARREIIKPSDRQSVVGHSSKIRENCLEPKRVDITCFPHVSPTPILCDVEYIGVWSTINKRTLGRSWSSTDDLKVVHTSKLSPWQVFHDKFYLLVWTEKYAKFFLDKSPCWKASTPAFQQAFLSRKNLRFFPVHTSK